MNLQNGSHGPPPPGAGYRGPMPYRAVFEFLPSGVIVVDAGGAVQGANLTARRLLDGDCFERPGLRCCDLLGCRKTGTPLARHCITELALGHDGPLPEVRVDVPGRGGQQGSVWVTAGPIGGSEPNVILQLRPGVVGDRRRRTDPHWIGGPRLRMFVLGRTRIESAEGPLTGEWLGHRPGQLLKYLVAHRERVVAADELIEVFWPASGPRGTTSVRQAIHTLRSRLEPKRERHGASSFVAARSGGYELELSSIWIDADDFEVAARAGLAAAAKGDVETADPALARAVDLYRGDFLSDEPYAEWAFGERDRMRDLAGRALRALAEIRHGAGDLESASGHLHRLAELEPFDMDVQRDLLAILIRRGRHQEAQRRHELVRRRYRRTFGEDPPLSLSELAAVGD